MKIEETEGEIRQVKGVYFYFLFCRLIPLSLNNVCILDTPTINKTFNISFRAKTELIDMS